MKKTQVIVLAVCALALVGCKGITKSFLGSEGGDSGVISIDSSSVYGKHLLRSANPLPGHSVIIHPDGTMEMRWVGTNATAPDANVPLTTQRQLQRRPSTWTVPLIVDPVAVPVPTPAP